MLQLRQSNVFEWGDPVGQVPLGNPGASVPVVSGTNQAGLFTLATKGWTPSTIGLLLGGDWVEIYNHSSCLNFMRQQNVNSISNAVRRARWRDAWEQTLLLRSGDTARLTAQNDWKTGTVVAEIWYRGALAKRSESSGEYCIGDSFRPD